MNELFIEAKVENMDMVLSFINERITGCTDKLSNQIGIVVDEVFSNISRYAYAPSTGFATIRVSAGDVLMIEFEDSGAAYDPLSKEDPDVSLPAEERSIGGLGVYMVKRLMDSVEYRRENGRNILTVKKRVR